jgi:hypothetical protein
LLFIKVSNGVVGKFNEIANSLQVVFTPHRCGVVMSAAEDEFQSLGRRSAIV